MAVWLVRLFCMMPLIAAASKANASPNEWTESHGDESAENAHFMPFFELGATTASASLGGTLWEPHGTVGMQLNGFELALEVAGTQYGSNAIGRTAFSFAPRVGYYAHLPVGRFFFQPFVVAQFHLQVQRNPNRGSSGATALGIDGGVRAMVCSEEEDETRAGWCVGVRIAARVRYHISDYAMGELVPKGSTLIAFPFSLMISRSFQ
ncbi:MAG: hypothetical protein AAF938_09645 [Myxococcota bacterium]